MIILFLLIPSLLKLINRLLISSKDRVKQYKPHITIKVFTPPGQNKLTGQDIYYLIYM